MSSEEVFTTAVGWSKMEGDLLREVVAEIGLQRTITVYGRAGKSTGAMFVSELKKLEPFSLEAMGKMFEQAYRPLGVINFEVVTTPDSLEVNVGRCPVYEGLKMAGLDDETIEKLCRSREGSVNGVIMEAFPGVKCSLVTWNKPDGDCVSRSSIEK